MRRIAHRLLTGFPALAVAILALLAAANPEGARRHLEGFVEMVSHGRFFWLCVVIIVGYFAVWWLTSIEPKSRRQRIQSGLRRFHHTLNSQLSRVRDCNAYEEVVVVREEMGRTLNEIGQWLQENMSQAAFEKFKSPHFNAVSWSWPGEHAHFEREGRTNLLSLNYARLKVLDEFLSSDGWDGDEPGFGQRLARRVRQPSSANRL
jgi:hypothetical protein